MERCQILWIDFKMVKFKISAIEYPFTPSFILKKNLFSFKERTKFAQKKVFWRLNLRKKESKTVYQSLSHSGSWWVIVKILWVIVDYSGS